MSREKERQKRLDLVNRIRAYYVKTQDYAKTKDKFSDKIKSDSAFSKIVNNQIFFSAKYEEVRPQQISIADKMLAIMEMRQDDYSWEDVSKALFVNGHDFSAEGIRKCVARDNDKSKKRGQKK